MLIDYAKITDAFTDLKDIAGDSKVSSFAMLKFTEAGIRVCYADNNTAYDKLVDGTMEEADTVRDVLVDIKMFNLRLQLFKTSGHVQLKPLSIVIDEDSLLMESKKFLIVATYGEDNAIATDADGNVVVEEMPGSIIKTRIKYAENVRASLTARTPFEELYISEKWETIEKQQFIKLMETLSKTLDCPQCIVASGKRVAFAPGRNYTAVVTPSDELLGLSYSITASAAIKLTNIFRKHDCENIKMCLAGANDLVKFVADTEDMAIKVNFSQVSRTALGGLERYVTTNFDLVKLQFNREVLLDTIRCAILVIESGAATSKLKFVYSASDDSVKLQIAKKGNGSSDEDLRVIAEHYTGEVEQLKDLEISVVFKVLEQMLNTCQEAVVELAISSGEQGQKVACISDITREPVTKEVESVGTRFFTCV